MIKTNLTNISVMNYMRVSESRIKGLVYYDKLVDIQWWFVDPDTFVPGRYFRINEFTGFMNRPLVQTWKSD